MENKILYIIVALAIIFAASVGIYLTTGDRFFSNGLDKGKGAFLNTESENQKSDFFGPNDTGDNMETEKLENEEDKVEDAEGGEMKDGKDDAKEEERNVLANEDFSIILPQGWQGSPPPIGASAIAIKLNETINDPAARKINFKSYFAISFDTLGDRSRGEYIQSIKDSLGGLSTEVNFTEEKQISVDGRDAYAVEIGIVQQGANFKVLMILVWGEKGDIWALSLNTVEEKWEDYRSLFYQTANDFQIK
jgi:hypothetical protein